MELWI